MPPPKDALKYMEWRNKISISKQGSIPWNKDSTLTTPLEWYQRFSRKFKHNTINNCWEWIAYIDNLGYGRFTYQGKYILAHVFAYEFHNGPIPGNLVVDHLCKNKKCVNPYHLDLTTRIDNVLRGSNLIARNSEKEFCPNGHEYSKSNTYLTKEGYRHCKKCHAIKESIRRQKGS